jgi:hypothetical protein
MIPLRSAEANRLTTSRTVYTRNFEGCLEPLRFSITMVDLGNLARREEANTAYPSRKESTSLQ